MPAYSIFPAELDAGGAASAPKRLVHFKNNTKSMTGPKDAPKPAQANETMLNEE